MPITLSSDRPLTKYNQGYNLIVNDWLVKSKLADNFTGMGPICKRLLTIMYAYFAQMNLLSLKSPFPRVNIEHFRFFRSQYYCRMHPGNRQTINSSPPGQNGRHFADDMFKRIFVNENIWISSKSSLKYISWGLIDKMSALVQIMTWCCSGDMLPQFTDAYMRH